MADRPTPSSVTAEPCVCGYLDRAADDADLPIAFDERTNEFHYLYPDPDNDGELATLIIRHCPHCGGAAPPSRRAQLFKSISIAEENRLYAMADGLNSVEEAVRKLGPPDEDMPVGMTSRAPAMNGDPPVVTRHRILRYTRLSDVATLDLIVQPSGTLSCHLLAKEIRQ